MAVRLLVTGSLPFGNGIIGLGGDIAWPKPTRPGDIMPVESRIAEITPARSKPNQGVVKVGSEMQNQNGEVVYVFTMNLLAARRARWKLAGGAVGASYNLIT